MAGDLHCHTKLSDGSLGIEDLISIAKKLGLHTISITDHDTLAGTVRGKVIGERYGLTVIPGVEFSCYDRKRGRKAHLLCYMAEYPDRLEGFCQKITIARKRAMQIMMMKVMQRYPITAEQIVKCASGSTNIFKQHIMHTLMDAGFADAVFGDVFRELFHPNSPDNVLSEPAYPDIFTLLEAVLDAGGIPVLAHPYQYDSLDLMEELTEKGLMGVEVWHPLQSRVEQAKLLDFAEHHRLLATGGTDFHGMYSEHISPLGTCVAPDEHVEALLHRKSKVRRQAKLDASR